MVCGLNRDEAVIPVLEGGVGVGCGAGGRRRVWTRTLKSTLLLGLPGGLLTRQLGLGLREDHW